MKTFRLICLISAGISAGAFARPGMPDWDGVSWNSPIDTLEEKYGEKLVNQGTTRHWGTGDYSDYVINNYRYLGEHFAATFVMDSLSNGLKRVILSLKDSLADYDSATFESIYSSLQIQLAQKYGVADSTGFIAKYGLRNGFAKWFLDSTTIEISSIYSAGLKTKTIDISFYESALAARSKKNLWKYDAVRRIGYDLRKVTWGYTKEQVKASETDAPEEDSGDAIAYRTTFAGLDCTVRYEFVDSTLVRAKYIVREQHADKNEYIIDYATLKSQLTEKVGRPGVDLDEQWKSDLYRDAPKNFGNAVSVGHLYYLSGWQLPKTTINLMLSGENHHIALVVEYASTALANKETTRKGSDAITIGVE
jgi:hypothetical protein